MDHTHARGFAFFTYDMYIHIFAKTEYMIIYVVFASSTLEPHRTKSSMFLNLLLSTQDKHGTRTQPTLR